jgi:hypothetical protein
MMLGCMLLLYGPVWAAEPSPKFTREPTAERTNGKVRIEFAVDRETDVAVYIEDAEGKIVRHLVAGVLGENPPAPLKPDALSQSIEWDLKDDDGKPVGAGPFEVRVRAGLQVSYAGTALFEETGPNHIGDVLSLAVAPDGRLYVLGMGGEKLHHYGTRMHVFRRDGSYEKTIKPFPSHLGAERLKPARAFRNARGEITPVLFYPWTMTFYPYSDISQSYQMALTPEGHLLLAVLPVPVSGKLDGTEALRPHLAAIDREGGIPGDAYAGPALLPANSGFASAFLGFSGPFIAASASGKHAYITGIGPLEYVKNQGHFARNSAAVYRVKLPERGPAEVFFGDPDSPGSDPAHLMDPRGIACDGKGHLLVSDFGSGRVVVIREKDRSVVGSIPVEAPGWVGVHPGTGAVYVQSVKPITVKTGSGTTYAKAVEEYLIKFSGWEAPRELARLPLPLPRHGHWMFKRSFALDASADPPVLWLGRNRLWYEGGEPLLRSEDRGDHFSEPARPGCYPSPGFCNLSVDPLRREVSSKMGRSPCETTLYVLNEESGEVRRVTTQRIATHGGIHRLGLDGQIFCMGVMHSLSRHDREGKLVPYDTTGEFGLSDEGRKPGLVDNTPTGNSGWTRGFAVGRQGDLYVQQRLAGSRQQVKKVDVFDGSTGRWKRTAIRLASHHIIGPRVDARGDIYLAEAVKPPGEPYPEEFKAHVGGRDNERWYNLMYGSIIKFSPRGGAIWWPVTWEAEAPGLVTPEKAGLPDALRKEKVGGCFWGKVLEEGPVLQGAEWYRPGFAHVCLKPMCHCLATEFDVDDFGRVYYPDLLGFRVGVLDTNGNEILKFGGYGNQDCCGPDSYVPDPGEKYFRPRRRGDPAGLRSPFAGPEIAFAWIVGVAVTDRYVYVADEMNRRIVRGRLGYTAEATCQVR